MCLLYYCDEKGCEETGHVKVGTSKVRGIFPRGVICGTRNLIKRGGQESNKGIVSQGGIDQKHGCLANIQAVGMLARGGCQVVVGC